MGIKYSIRISTKYNLKYISQSTNYSKMKFSFTLLALVAAEEVAQDDTWYGAGSTNAIGQAVPGRSGDQGPRSGQAVATGDEDTDRRYDDLESIGEFVRYTWKYASKFGDFVSNNADGSCEREL